MEKLALDMTVNLICMIFKISVWMNWKRGVVIVVGIKKRKIFG